MRVLAIDSAVGRCSVTYVRDSLVAAADQADAARGQPGVLAGMVGGLLQATSMQVADLDLIAVTVGPGSFTGIRSAIALAQGLGLGAGIPVIGVTVGEALGDSLPFLGQRTLWTAMPSRPGRMFIETPERTLSVPAEDLPVPPRPVAIAGTSALEAASWLAARGANVMLTDARYPAGQHIAAVSVRRFRGELRPLPAEPLYVDAPEAKTPALPHRAAPPQ
jgi:tRNA threonylcarbamoyladenosine biosynthesis protein TsaB